MRTYNVLSVGLLLAVAGFLSVSGRQFALDYERDSFTMDGEPFRYISGSLHYFRSPSQYWRQRLRTLRDAGLNAVSTYVEWSQHEKVPGQYDFSGELNVTNFINIAKEEGLYVILRPGPYICAERDMGGLPFWLLQKNPDVRLRTSDPKYTKYVERWLVVLLTEVKPLLYGNGGPVILVQVENEYGSYFACDRPHLIWLRDLFNKYVEDNAVLFTTDGGSSSYLKCGKIPGVYATVDFGLSFNVTQAFAAQRAYEPQGPLVNSEFYPGWLTHWGEPLAKTATQPVVNMLRQMYEMGANINFYMFHGGTNFGFTAGANFDSSYQADITSYDYDAPMTEAGDITAKYEAIQHVISELNPNATIKHHERIVPKGDYGQLVLKPAATLLSQRMRQTLGKKVQAEKPLTFEALGQHSGYLVYETTVLTRSKAASVNLTIPQINDRGVVLINGAVNSVLDRESNTHSAAIPATQGDNLGIVTENLGRINYGSYLNDSKGILSDVLLGEMPLTNWSMTSFSLEDISPILDCLGNNVGLDCIEGNSFVFYVAKFVVPANMTDSHFLPDTYIDTTNLKKGLAFVNGFNLGRYWTLKGPQLSLYVPGVYLNKSPLKNTIIILDESIYESSLTLKFSPTPIWSSKVKIHS